MKFAKLFKDKSTEYYLVKKETDKEPYIRTIVAGKMDIIPFKAFVKRYKETKYYEILKRRMFELDIVEDEI